MSQLVVKNLNGTSDNKCKCGSWIAHWSKYNPFGSERAICVVSGCSNDARAGAHVQLKNEGTDNSWYIVPFCSAHNNHMNTDEMPLKPGVTIAHLARANVSLTCGNK